jgi:hypothetical protein
MTMRARSMLLGTLIALATSPAGAQSLSDPTLADLERLRPASGRIMLLEFYDKDRRKVGEKRSSYNDAPQAGDGVSFKASGLPTLRLWGLRHCDHGQRLVDGSFDGPCNTFIRVGLISILKSGPVLLCRAFADQQERAAIDASCFVLVSYPSVYGVTKIEEFLISGGYAQLVRDAAGKALRPDLEDDERIAKGFGRGLWSFEHERIRREQRQ